jgi:hypothetical protein
MASKKYVVSQGVANNITKLNIQQQLSGIACRLSKLVKDMKC